MAWTPTLNGRLVRRPRHPASGGDGPRTLRRRPVPATEPNQRYPHAHRSPVATARVARDWADKEFMNPDPAEAPRARPRLETADARSADVLIPHGRQLTADWRVLGGGQQLGKSASTESSRACRTSSADLAERCNGLPPATVVCRTEAGRGCRGARWTRTWTSSCCLGAIRHPRRRQVIDALADGRVRVADRTDPRLEALASTPPPAPRAAGAGRAGRRWTRTVRQRSRP